MNQQMDHWKNLILTDHFLQQDNYTLCEYITVYPMIIKKN